MLPQNSADPSLKVNHGFSLLHCAVKGGNTSIINEPLSRDLDADSRSNDDFTPLMTVAYWISCSFHDLYEQTKKVLLRC